MTEKTETWNVSSDAARVRLDQYLLSRIPDQSRSHIQALIRQGWIRVNDLKVKTGYQLKPGDTVRYTIPPPRPTEAHPEDIPLSILYQDPDLAVVEKPAGMVCHLGAGVHSGTLVNALLYLLGPLETGDPSRPGIVHRLDKMTSGVMVVARNPIAHRSLAQQFKKREVKKEYLALVYGRLEPEKGTIDLPLGRDPRDRKKMSVRARKKRSAITHYSVLKELGALSLVMLRIETGRTHQIRVHLAQKGHPVVGDGYYGGRRSRNLPECLRAAVENLGRIFLHSHRLEFRHPRTAEVLSFSSHLPRELVDFLERLQ